MDKKPKSDGFFKLGASSKKDVTKPSEENSRGFFGNSKPTPRTTNEKASKPTPDPKQQSGFFAPASDANYYRRGLIPPQLPARHELAQDETPNYSPEEQEERKQLASDFDRFRASFGVNFDTETSSHDSRVEVLLKGKFLRATTAGIKRHAEIMRRNAVLCGLYNEWTVSQKGSFTLDEAYKEKRSWAVMLWDEQVSSETKQPYSTQNKSLSWVEKETVRLAKRNTQALARKEQEAQKAERAAEAQRKNEEAKANRLREKQAKIDAKAKAKKDTGFIRDLERRIVKAKKIEAKQTHGSLFYGSAAMERDLSNYKKYGSTTAPLQYDEKQVQRVIEIYSKIHAGKNSDIFNHMFEM